MSTPNPLAPQGSLLEQQAKSRSSLQVMALIVGLHVVVLGGFLILGCSKEKDTKPSETPSLTDGLSHPLPALGDTNAPAIDLAASTTLPAGYGLASTSAPPVGTLPPATIPPVFDPVPAPAPAPSAALAAGEHKVQKGDIAYNIAKQHGVSLKALKDANANVDLGKLKVGQTLQIPAGSAAPEPKTPALHAAEAAPAGSGDTVTYTVKGGDNLTKIAKKFGTTVKAIRSASGLKGNDIKVGQKLKVPGKAAAPAAAPSSEPAPATLPTATPALPTATAKKRDALFAEHDAAPSRDTLTKLRSLLNRRKYLENLVRDARA